MAGFFSKRDRFNKGIEQVNAVDFTSVPATDSVVWRDGLPMRDGSFVTPKRALALPAVYRSVSVIANLCSDLPLEATREGELLVPQPRLITKPDPDRSYRDFVHRTVICLALHGEAFFKITRDARKQVSFLQVLDPNLVTPQIDEKGVKTYLVGMNGKTFTYTDNDVYHLRLMQVPGEIRGLGPIQSARLSLNNYLQTQEAAEGFLGDRAIPSGVLTTDMQTNKEATEAVAQAWVDMLANPGSVAVLPSGWNYNALSLNPADLQYIESQNFGVLDIARLFGVPASYVNAGVDGNSETYQNVQDLNKVFLSTTLRSYLGVIESAMTDLLPGLQKVAFNTENLIGNNETEKITNLKTAVDAGIMTIDEARARLGLEPLGEEAPEA